MSNNNSNIQSIIFDKSKWSEEQAEQWLNKHGHHPIKSVHETTNFLRYRQANPNKFKHYITKKLNNGSIELIIGFK